MGRKGYPAECPAFEIVETGYTYQEGAIVVGEGIDEGDRQYVRVAPPDTTEVSPECAARLMSERKAYKRRMKENGGYLWSYVRRDQIRPLTPAARAMLALVKGK